MSTDSISFDSYAYIGRQAADAIVTRTLANDASCRYATSTSMKIAIRALVALLCVGAAVGVTSSAWLAIDRAQRDDRNHDGRPDEWRFYDATGQLTYVSIDTNFDGRSDEQDYYSHGVLVRRERDRNLDDRVDLVESFDPTNHQEIRSVEDVDYNGVADVLILFRDGVPVYSERLRAEAPESVGSAPDTIRRAADDRLLPLFDPTKRDASVSSSISHSQDERVAALVSVIGLPERVFQFAVSLDGLRAGSQRLLRQQRPSCSLPVTRGPPFPQA